MKITYLSLLSALIASTVASPVSINPLLRRYNTSEAISTGLVLPVEAGGYAAGGCNVPTKAELLRRRVLPPSRPRRMSRKRNEGHQAQIVVISQNETRSTTQPVPPAPRKYTLLGCFASADSTEHTNHLIITPYTSLDDLANQCAAHQDAQASQGGPQMFAIITDKKRTQYNCLTSARPVDAKGECSAPSEDSWIDVAVYELRT